LKVLTKRKFIPHLLGLVSALLVILICYNKFLKDSNSIFSSSLFLTQIIGITLLFFLIHFIFSSGVFHTIFKKNQRIVYSGILSGKKIKENTNPRRYVFYMDGMKFSVQECDFKLFNIGDFLQFHVSLNGKYLIKISKPSEKTAC
jgi:hypothetical protein